MHILGYIVICLTTAYAAIYVFSFGWSSVLASFLNAFYHVAAFTIPAGVIAGIPKKTTFKVAGICALLWPASVTLIMLQGIIENNAFNELHWATLPIGGSVIAISAFVITKKLMTIMNRPNTEEKN